ncbi:acyltransferase family protein [Janibacter limosus]|uniref:acyltransferase family protein n=1 Tax=Janibacter limosus TaxID=53458 RepID=UPI0035E1200C|nr:acyltransferase family protein [Janibacter limosus]
MVGDDISTATQRPGRILGLDLLRAVAAWLILLSHVAFWTGAGAHGTVGGPAVRGELGVAVFFALSAFLLSTPFVRRGLGDRAPWSAPGDTSCVRAARILPAYLLALAAVVAVAAAPGGAAGSVLDLPTVLVHLVVGRGFTGRTFQSFTQTRSLTTEITFYVLLPVVALLVAPLVRADTPVARARRMLVLCAVVAVGGLCAQAASALVPDPQWAGVIATSAAGHAARFAIGTAATVLVEAERAGIEVTPRPALAVLRTSPGTLVLLAIVAWVIASTPIAGPRGVEASTPAQAPAAEVLYGVVAASLLLAGTSRGLTESLTASPWREPCAGSATSPTPSSSGTSSSCRWSSRPWTCDSSPLPSPRPCSS